MNSIIDMRLFTCLLMGLAFPSCGDGSLESAADIYGILEQKEQLRRSGRCEDRHTTKDNYLCGKEAVNLYAALYQTKGGVEIYFNSYCENHSLSVEDMVSELWAATRATESDLRATQERARQDMIDNGVYPPDGTFTDEWKTVDIVVCMQPTPSDGEYDSVASSMEVKARGIFKAKQRSMMEARAAAQAKAQRVHKAKQRLSEIQLATDHVQFQIRSAEKGVEREALLAPQILESEEKVSNIAKQLGLQLDASAEGLTKEIEAFMKDATGHAAQLELSNQRLNLASTAITDLAEAWTVEATKILEARPRDEQEAGAPISVEKQLYREKIAKKVGDESRDMSWGDTRKFAFQAARDMKLRSEAKLSETQKNLLSTHSRAQKNSQGRTEEALRLVGGELARIETVFGAARLDVAEATEEAKQSVRWALAKARLSDSLWDESFSLTVTAVTRAEEALAAAEKSEASSLKMFEEADRQAEAAFLESSAVQTNAMEASDTAYMVVEEALEGLAVAGRSVTEDVEAKAANLRAMTRKQVLGMVSRAARSSQTEGNYKSLLKGLEAFVDFEKSCNELLELTMEYVDLHESAQSPETALEAKKRMAKIGGRLSIIRSRLVTNPLPVNSKTALFLLQHNNDSSSQWYELMQKRAVRVDRINYRTTSLGSAFDHVADRMELSWILLFKSYNDPVDPDGKIREILSGISPGPSLGIPYVRYP